jgi:hypothetical protein
VKQKPKLAGLVGLCVIAGAALASDASAAVIAHYRFEPDAFLEDSSSNDLDLLNTTNATSSTDVTTGGGAGSALFDGNDFLATEATLDLTPYRHIRVSWIQRLQADQIGIVYEHSANWNNFNGALLGIARGDIGNSPVQGYAGIGLGGTYNLDTFPHPAAGVPGTWAAFSVEYDLDAGTAAGVTRIFDGNGNEIGSTLHTQMPTTFRNDFLYIGARAGGGAGFVGNIDELLIETVEVPEPGTLALAAAGSLVALLRRR